MRFMIRLASDITIKSDTTRRRFMRTLIDNFRDGLRTLDIDADFENRWSRIYVDSDDARVEQVGARIFGVHSIAPVEKRTHLTYEQVIDETATYFLPHVRGRTFAVRARCAGKTTLHGSRIEIDLGARLSPHAKVQLVDPEVTCHVEVRDELVHFYRESTPGPRGLPLGTEGRAVVLLSGGFDSAVAAWMMMRRGVDCSYVFCRLGGAVHTQATLRVAQILGQTWAAGTRPRIYVVPFEDVAENIRARCRPSHWQLALKRLMYRAAERAAHRSRAQAIVTGEALGQVSSQTLSNLVALEGDLRLPLLRPLLGLDKEEIIARSRRIGTYDISATVQEYCAITPSKPAVAATRAQVEQEEKLVEFDWHGLSQQVRVLDVRNMSDEELQIDGLEVEHIPDGAVLLDLRGKRAYDAWHYPGALRMELSHALKHVNAFDTRKTYVLYCEFGLKSAHLAERMQSAGLVAYNFHGGLRNLVAYAVRQRVVPAEVLGDPSLLIS